MHTKITQFQLILWFAVLGGQILVGGWAGRRRNRPLAMYMGVEVANSLLMFAVARLGSAHAYYLAYIAGSLVDYGAQVYLVVAIFCAIRKTGIPNNHAFLLQVLALAALAVAILTMRFPLVNVFHAWRWFLAVDHVAFYWLCLMLMAAPFYAWMVDSAKDTRLLLVYVGFAVNTAVHAAAVDLAIATHLIYRFAHIPDFTYFLSLAVWLYSSHFPFAAHHWDPAQTELLKTALRTKRSHINQLSSSIERSPLL